MAAADATENLGRKLVGRHGRLLDLKAGRKEEREGNGDMVAKG